MTLVQRLTGPDSTYASSSTAVQPSTFDGAGAVSPAARFASVEKTRSTRKPELGTVQGIELISDVERSGVLSPNPASLPAIPASIFSSPSGQNPLGYFPDLSPVFHSNKIYGLETSFMLPSPSAAFISPRIISPGTPSLDLFNNLFDL
nr:protein MKS1-like [Ipomoea batatas]